MVLPTAGELIVALKTNNRKFIYDAFRKLKIAKDKTGYLKFVVKESKTGKMLVSFKGFSGLRSFLTTSSYGIDNLKVGMIASAASASAAGSIAGGLKSAARSGAKSLGGIGFGLVAVFDIAEWLTSDDPFNKWSDLWTALGIDAVKAVIATAVGVVAGTAAVMLGAPVAGVIVTGGVFVAVTSFGLEWLDRQFEVTSSAQNAINAMGY